MCCFTKLPTNVTASAVQERWGIHAKQHAHLPGKKRGVTVSKALLVSSPGLEASSQDEAAAPACDR